jgi:hypothetical protein
VPVRLKVEVAKRRCSFREFRSGLWIDPDAVIVRGIMRTRRFSPDELDGFKPEMRLAPSPLLHREHGSPVIVGALAHGRHVYIEHFYGLDHPPEPGELERIAEPWRPFRTWASVLIRVAGDRLRLPVPGSGF